MIENTCLGNNDFLEFLITEGLFLITLFCTNLHNLTIIADFLIFIHPHEHKVKTINYILTPAVKCWHFVFKKKKVQKSVSLNQGNVGKGHSASGNLQQQKAHAAVSCRGSKLHWKRSCCQLKYCLLSHPRTNCVRGEGIRRAGSSCRKVTVVSELL